MEEGPKPTEVPYLEPTKKMQAAYLELAMEQIAGIRTRNDARAWVEEHGKGYKRDLAPSQVQQVQKRFQHVVARLGQRRGH